MPVPTQASQIVQEIVVYHLVNISGITKERMSRVLAPSTDTRSSAATVVMT